MAAPQLRVDGRYSLFEISLSWTKLQSFTESQGTVLEYNVQYWPIDIEMKPSMEYSIMSVTVKAPKRSTKLVNLRPFTKYGIRMAAATQTGVGKYTNIHYGGKWDLRCIVMVAMKMVDATIERKGCSTLLYLLCLLRLFSPEDVTSLLFHFIPTHFAS